MSEGLQKSKVAVPSTEQGEGRRRRPIVIAGIVLAVLVIAAIGWSTFGPGAGKKPARERVVPVVVAPATTKAMPVEIATYGRVQTIASVAVKPRVDGVITEVRVKEGQDVNVGDVLFVLDDREFRARLKQAEGAVARDK